MHMLMLVVIALRVACICMRFISAFNVVIVYDFIKAVLAVVILVVVVVIRIKPCPTFCTLLLIF